MADTNDLRARLDLVEQVIADPIHFKRQLRIGEAAYQSLRATKLAQEGYEIGGMAWTGGAIASSQAVANFFFANTARTGIMGWLGLGTATTPIGWVVAASLGSAAAYYGVVRLYRSYAGTKSDVIPHFINTPMDLLATSLFDFLATLAVIIAKADDDISDSEQASISNYFVTEWGYSSDFVDAAMAAIIAGAGKVDVELVAVELARFKQANPDCNAKAMRAELMAFLKEVALADGHMDAREQWMLDRIDKVMERELSGRLENFFKSCRDRLVSLTRSLRT